MFAAENEIVETIEAIPTLDRDQLRDVTMDDEDLMREVLSVLWDDTSAQVPKLEAAVRSRYQEQCVRLAHCSRGVRQCGRERGGAGIPSHRTGGARGV